MILNKKNTKIFIVILIICCIIIGMLSMKNNILRCMYKKDYSEYVQKYAQEYNVDENLIYSVIKAESNFNEEAVSNKGAKGLMQLMDNTAKDTLKKTELKISSEELSENLFNSEININLGTKYISVLLEKYQNTEIAITAYNAGIGTVDTWIEKGVIKADGSDVENIPYKETNNYVRKILRDYKIYRGLY